LGVVDWCTIFPSSGIGNGVDDPIQVGYTVCLCRDDILRHNEIGAKTEPGVTISIIGRDKQHEEIDRTNKKYFRINSTSIDGVASIKNRIT